MTSEVLLLSPPLLAAPVQSFLSHPGLPPAPRSLFKASATTLQRRTHSDWAATRCCGASRLDCSASCPPLNHSISPALTLDDAACSAQDWTRSDWTQARRATLSHRFRTDGNGDGGIMDPSSPPSLAKHLSPSTAEAQQHPHGYVDDADRLAQLGYEQGAFARPRSGWKSR